METLWFILVALMLTAYVVLDGFDIGVGIIYLLIGKTNRERRLVLRTIGPVWDGNEVWLLAAGGTLYFAFPLLYASSFSGFYLPLMMVLWLLILRAVGIEFRTHIDHQVWRSFFDGVFSLSSVLLAVFFGAALGNVIRGVPLAPDGYFFEPLWTNWKIGPHPGILDWYTVVAGVVALAALGVHGGLYVATQDRGRVERPRSRRCRAAVAHARAPNVRELGGYHLGAAPGPRQLQDSSRQFLDPDCCFRMPWRNVLDCAEGKRQAGLCGVQPLSRWHAGGSGFGALSECDAGDHRSRLQPHDLQHRHRPPWLARRARLVGRRHDLGGRLLCLHLSQVPGQGQT
jgi:hypothetical protein